MSHYIKATKPVVFADQVVPWADCVRAIFNDARLQKALPVFDLIDLRRRLLELAPDSPALCVSDAEWSALKTVCEHVEVLTPAFLYADGAEEFLRAFVNAPTKAPAAEVEANGAHAQA